MPAWRHRIRQCTAHVHRTARDRSRDRLPCRCIAGWWPAWCDVIPPETASSWLNFKVVGLAYSMNQLLYSDAIVEALARIRQGPQNTDPKILLSFRLCRRSGPHRLINWLIGLRAPRWPDDRRSFVGDIEPLQSASAHDPTCAACAGLASPVGFPLSIHLEATAVTFQPQQSFEMLPTWSPARPGKPD